MCPNTSAGVGTLLVFLSAGCAFLAMITHSVAFGADYWIVGEQGTTPFLRIGMHHACFDQCRFPYCPGGDHFTYDGCHWFYDYYFEEIVLWLIPDWYVNIRNIAIAVVPLTGVTLILACIAACVVGCWRYPREKTPCRNYCVQAMLIISAIFMIATAMAILIILGKFSMYGFSYSWLPMPEKNHFGFSFWLEVVTCIVNFIGFMLTVIAIILKTVVDPREPKNPRVADDMMLGRI